MAAAECDVLLARLATRQSGVAAFEQLVALGFSRNEIDHRVNAGRLIRIHKGVYAVGHADVSDRGRVIAALLAAGDGAVVSHRTAAALWKLLPLMPQLIEVTVTNRRPRQRQGLKIHHATRLETTVLDGIPITTPIETLRQLKGPDAERAWSEALYRGLIDRHEAPADAEPTRSALERKLRAALGQAGLPMPISNHPIGRYTADFFWPHHRLIVETDGWAAHGHRNAFEHDARDAWLQASGYSVVRFTWRQVMHETVLVAVRIAQLLARVPHHAPDNPPAGG